MHWGAQTNLDFTQFLLSLNFVTFKFHVYFTFSECMRVSLQISASYFRPWASMTCEAYCLQILKSLLRDITPLLFKNLPIPFAK